MPFRPKNSRFWHYDFQIKGCRFHGSCGTESYEQAKAIEAQARVEAKTSPAAQGSFTLGEALGTYWTDVSQHQSSSATTLSQGKGILSALPASMLIDRITMADVQRLITLRRALVANGTVNRELQLLGRSIRHMVKVHGVTAPALAISTLHLKEPKERVRELTMPEQARLFAKLRPDLHNLVKFALMTGAREATICGLQWSDVDLTNGRIRFDMKGEDEMFFPVSPEMRAFLSALPRAQERPHSAFVITYEDQGTKQRKRVPTGGGGLKSAFHAATLAAEVPDFRFHDLRHTFGTRMLRKTKNLKLVSRLMGHRNLETTARYAHVLMDDLQDAVADFTALETAQSRRKSRSKS